MSDHDQGTQARLNALQIKIDKLRATGADEAQINKEIEDGYERIVKALRERSPFYTSTGVFAVRDDLKARVPVFHSSTDIHFQLTQEEAGLAVEEFERNILRTVQIGGRKQEQGAALNNERLETLAQRWKRAQEIFDAIHRDNIDYDYPRLRLETLKQLKREGIRASYKSIDRNVICPPEVKREKRKKIL